MPSNTERGKAFQLLCRNALKLALSRDFDLEVPIQIGSGKPHTFDLATILSPSAKHSHSPRLGTIRQPRSRRYVKPQSTSARYGATFSVS